MERETNNELEPVYYEGRNFWNDACLTLIEQPDKVLPVIVENKKSKHRLGDFFLLIAREGNFTYMQAEDFSTSNAEYAFMLTALGGKWEKIQPGIYRLDITEALKRIE